LPGGLAGHRVLRTALGAGAALLLGLRGGAVLVVVLAPAAGLRAAVGVLRALVGLGAQRLDPLGGGGPVADLDALGDQVALVLRERVQRDVGGLVQLGQADPGDVGVQAVVDRDVAPVGGGGDEVLGADVGGGEVVAGAGHRGHHGEEHQDHRPPAAGALLGLVVVLVGGGGGGAEVGDAVHLGGVAGPLVEVLRAPGRGVRGHHRLPALVGGADQERLLGGAALVGRGVDHVGDHRGDVVRSAAPVGQVDQAPGGRLRAGLAEQRLLDRLGADHAGQAVGAEQVAVADGGLAHRDVRVDLAAAVQ